MTVRQCSVDGCQNPYSCKGFCSVHYDRWRRHGSEPVLRGRHTGPEPNKWRDPAPRFWARVDVRKPTDCWLWTGSRRHRYGEIWVRGKRSYAHRLSYELAHGPIPDGLLVRHACDTPLCVNPAHLSLGTQKDNMRDASERGRWRNQFASGGGEKAETRVKIRRSWKRSA